MFGASEAASAVNAVDIIILVVLGVSFIYGILRGFVLQLAGIVFLIVGLMLAGRFSGRFGDRINAWFPGLGSPMDDIVAFGLILVGTVVAGHILALMFRGLLEKMKLLSYDRFLGGVLGLAKFGILAGVLVYGLVAFLERPEDEEPMGLVTVIKESRSWPLIEKGADLIKPLIPERQKEKLVDIRDDLKKGADMKKELDAQKGTSSGD